MSKTIKNRVNCVPNIDVAMDIMPNHYCALRVRNHMRNDIDKALADAFCHKARHGEINEHFIAYATDSTSIRLYGFSTKKGYLLILQKHFCTVASMLTDQNTFMAEFDKAIACYKLSRKFGGRLFSLNVENSAHVGSVVVSAILYKINGQRCVL